jgi:ABC-type nitrate/sulfonate/bicarbonate transport system substrate-binding protein
MIGTRGPQRPRRRSNRMAAVAVAVTATLVLAGCATGSADSGDGGGEAVSFQLDWVKNSQFAGFFEADDAGYYSDAGLDVTFLDGGDVASTAAVIAGGGAQIGIVSNMARYMDALETGADLVAVGALYQQSPAGIMTLPDRTITSVDDLAGLTIGTDESGTADINTLFAVNGLEPDWEDVRVGYDAAPLFDGQIDAYYAYVTNQPVSYDLAGQPSNTVTFADLGFESYGGLIVTTREYLESNRDTVESFVAATTKGWADAIDDPEAAVDLVTESYGADLGLDPAAELGTLEAQVPLMTSDFTDANGLFALDPALIEGPMYDALTASGRESLPEVSSAFDTGVVEAANE